MSYKYNNLPHFFTLSALWWLGPGSFSSPLELASALSLPLRIIHSLEKDNDFLGEKIWYSIGQYTCKVVENKKKRGGGVTALPGTYQIQEYKLAYNLGWKTSQTFYFLERPLLHSLQICPSFWKFFGASPSELLFFFDIVQKYNNISFLSFFQKFSAICFSQVVCPIRQKNQASIFQLFLAIQY